MGYRRRPISDPRFLIGDRSVRRRSTETPSRASSPTSVIRDCSRRMLSSTS